MSKDNQERTVASSRSDQAGGQTNVASSVDQGRREALKKFGKYGAYTAPVLLGVLVADKAFAQVTIDPP